MLSEPVARITSPAATSEAAPPQDISTGETYPQQTVRVKKPNGSAEPVAVGNLGSINFGRHTATGADGTVALDIETLARTVRSAVHQLDRVIDLNYYPIAAARSSNLRWRPVGLGLLGLQDVFFQMRLPFDAPEACALSARISEEVYFHALSASVELAITKGRHPAS